MGMRNFVIRFFAEDIFSIGNNSITSKRDFEIVCCRFEERQGHVVAHKIGHVFDF